MTQEDSLANVIWEKAPESGNTGECVEVGLTATATGVRNSRSPQAGHLVVSATTWGRFTRIVDALTV